MGAGRVRLYRCHFPATVKRTGAPVLVLMHGYGEHCRRYDEFARFMAARGVSVASFDTRGHGQSGGQRGYVREFEDYVDDLCVFFDSVTRSDPERPVVLMGHSNGGLIAMVAVERGALQPAALILTNPLVELHARRRPVPDWLAELLSRTVPRLPLPSGVRAADLTHDALLIEARRRDRLCHSIATPGWYWSTLRASAAALAGAARLRLAVLMVQSDQDSLVEPRAVKLCFDRITSKDKQLLVRSGAYHEALNETDRQELYQAIASWIEARFMAPALGR